MTNSTSLKLSSIGLLSLLAVLCGACNSSASVSTLMTTVAPASATLSYNGKLADRIGTGPTAVSKDGNFDLAFTVKLSPESGNRTVKQVDLITSEGGLWSTRGSECWVAGLASSKDAALYNNASGGVNFEAKAGETFNLFAADSGIKNGSKFIVTLHFADGTTTETEAVASWSQASITLNYSDKLTDRVGMGPAAVSQDGLVDLAFTVKLSPESGNRVVTQVDVITDQGGLWSTRGNECWVAGLSGIKDAALHNNASGGVNFEVKTGGTFNMFIADGGGNMNGRTFTITLLFADGTMASANTKVP